ncbi:MAG: ABC transporter permease [Oscillospiraceae bacterium]|nr:ABC transporter permease [Oscillospiraceae bacterium]
MATKSGRTIAHIKQRSVGSVLLRWESILFLIFLAVNIVNYSLSPDKYFNTSNLLRGLRETLVSGMIVFPMAFILLLGDIDLSVGGNVCLSATVLGLVYNASGSIWLGILAAVATGTVCGLINGLLLTRFTELAPMVVTLATNILYRGISEGILGDTATKGMQKVDWFKSLYFGKLGDIYYILIIFLVLAVIFGLVMHKTVFGRQMFAVGENKRAAKYAGIGVEKIRLIVFTLAGFMCGITAMFYCAKTGSVMSNAAEGYELDAICVCVLGGISTAGGKGTLPGAMIAFFTIALLKYGLGLVNIKGQIINVIIGALLVVVVMIPTVQDLIKKHRIKK